LRSALDLAVAFMTLESYELDDLRPRRTPNRDDRHDPVSGEAAAGPSSTPAGRVAVGTGPLTLPHHRHRHALRAPTRDRRPGASAPREQLCLTPIEGPTTTEPTVTSSRGRHAAAQDTPR
jgi:hypothetical protein